MESDAIQSKVLAAVQEALVPQALRLTHPVFARDSNDDLELLGSGVILSIGPGRYVVTASHVITQAESRHLLIGDGPTLRVVQGRRWRATSDGASPGSEADRIDVSIIRLEAALAADVSADATVSLAAIDFDLEPDARNPVLLSGYPCSRHRHALQNDTFSAESYSLMAFELDASEYASVGIDRSIHLAIDLDRKDIWGMGGPRTAPSLNGMSGSGIWRMSVYDQRPANTVRLAAIFIEHFQRARIKHVAAPRITAILALLASKDVECRSALEEIGVRVA